jgi:glutathione S-transferase
MFIQEKKLEIETINLDLRKSEQMEKWFSDINPRNTVPTFITKDKNVLFHSLPICVYLEEEFKDINLLGFNGEEKSLILNFINDSENNLFSSVADCLRNTSKAMEGRAITGPTNFAQIPELADRGRTRVKSYFKILETHLQGKSFICSERFTAADIWAFVAVDFSRVIKEPIPENYDSLKNWHSKIAQRSSAALNLPK